MAILCSLVVLSPLADWQQRLLSEHFVQPPWQEQQPQRLAIAQDLPADCLRLAQTIDRLVDQLSLQPLVDSYRPRSDRPYRPDLLLKAVLWFTHQGQHQPAFWFFQAQQNRVVQWLLRGLRPARARWYAFRDRLVPFIDELNQQLLLLAHQRDLLHVTVPILDGTLLAANSSRHKLLNQKTLQRRLQLLEQAGAADEADQADPPPATAPIGPLLALPQHEPTGPLPALPQHDLTAAAAAAPPAAASLVPVVADELTPEPAPSTPAATSSTAQPQQPADSPLCSSWMAQTASGRQRQQKHYHKVAEELQQRLEQNSRRRKEDRKPVEQVRISVGDPEATLGLDKAKVYRPLYNVQIASDLDSDFCLAYGVYRGVYDGATLLPMVQRLRSFVPWADIRQLLTDAGFVNGPNLRQLADGGIELLAPWQENDYSSGKKRKQIPKSQFCWDEASDSYVCPQGHSLQYVRSQTKRTAQGEYKQKQYRCAAQACQNCPLQADCTSKPDKGRMVVRNEFEEEIQQLQQRMQTEEAKQLYKKRKEQIERRFADCKQHRHLRCLSKRGQAGAQLQVGLVCLAHNIVLFDKLDQATSVATPDDVKT